MAAPIVSDEARAVIDALRAQRDQTAGSTTVPSRAEQRALADRIGDSTSEPTGVVYEDVVADGVPAQWATPEAADPHRVLLYFHGGGYCFCSVRSHRRLVGHLARAASWRALSVDYRLAPEHPFPAALVDALAAYLWILENGVDAANVVVAGDSAGGGLALALLLQLRDEGTALPGGAVLMSPWVDLAMSGESLTTRAHLDVRQDPAGTGWCAKQYLAGTDPHNPLASPLYGDLTGLPPLYVQAGDWDVLVDDSARLAEKLRASGGDVRLDVFPGMLHAHQIWAGAVPEADDAVARIGAWLRTQVGSTV